MNLCCDFLANQKTHSLKLVYNPSENFLITKSSSEKTVLPVLSKHYPGYSSYDDLRNTAERCLKEHKTVSYSTVIQFTSKRDQRIVGDCKSVTQKIYRKKIVDIYFWNKYVINFGGYFLYKRKANAQVFHLMDVRHGRPQLQMLLGRKKNKRKEKGSIYRAASLIYFNDLYKYPRIIQYVEKKHFLQKTVHLNATIKIRHIEKSPVSLNV